MKITEVQKDMLKQMLAWDQDYSFDYNWFEGIDRKTLKKEMKILREIGLSKMSRGGINDDGEVVGGTHFYIPYEKRREVEVLVNN